MNKSRLEAFSDGVIAILITIMVLELRARMARTGARCAASYRRFSVRVGLRAPRHLLEQPSSHAAGNGSDQWRDPVGESAPALLALSHPVRDKLDGRQPLR